MKRLKHLLLLAAVAGALALPAAAAQTNTPAPAPTTAFDEALRCTPPATAPGCPVGPAAQAPVQVGVVTGRPLAVTG